MSTENDLFTEDKRIPVVDPEKNYLEEFVGEGKKYKTVEDLARSKAEADAFIERMKSEAEELRTDLQSRVTLEDLMNRIQPRDPGTPPEGDPDRKTPPADALTPDKISEIVSREVEARQEKDRRARNAAFVKQELQKVYGKDYVSRLTERAKELGVTTEFLNDLAQTQPKVFLATVGKIPDKGTDIAPPRNSMSGERLPPVSHDKNYKYYEDLRRKDPKVYFSVKVQNEMHREAVRQGETFYD